MLGLLLIEFQEATFMYLFVSSNLGGGRKGELLGNGKAFIHSRLPTLLFLLWYYQLDIWDSINKKDRHFNAVVIWKLLWILCQPQGAAYNCTVVYPTSPIGCFWDTVELRFIYWGNLNSFFLYLDVNLVKLYMLHSGGNFQVWDSCATYAILFFNRRELPEDPGRKIKD